MALANGEISQQQYDALQREIVETENELKRLETEAKNAGSALQKSEMQEKFFRMSVVKYPVQEKNFCLLPQV